MSSPHRTRPRALYRLLLLAAILAGLYAAAKATGVTDRLDAAAVRELVESAGPLGVVVFVVAFTLGELVQVPGMIFVGAAVLAYGRGTGFLISLLAAVISVSVSFAIVRGVGGRALEAVERPFIRKMLARLDQRPITTVIVLRTVLWIAPPLNYALALSGIRFRDYLVGSALGLALPILVASFSFEALVVWMSP